MYIPTWNKPKKRRNNGKIHKQKHNQTHNRRPNNSNAACNSFEHSTALVDNQRASPSSSHGTVPRLQWPGTGCGTVLRMRLPKRVPESAAHRPARRSARPPVEAVAAARAAGSAYALRRATKRLTLARCCTAARACQRGDACSTPKAWPLQLLL